MAAPAPRRDAARPGPGRLPAVERNLRTERAKRRARSERERERRAARRRFLFLLLLLVVAAVFLGLTILDEISSLFGI
jgi:cell division septal protein FtsQ